MPAESEAQRRWAYGVKGPDWAERHHFDNPGKLPRKVKAGYDEEEQQVMSEDKKPYGNVEYADPGYQSDKQHRYPIDTEEHARAAWSYINKGHNASQYSSEDLAKVKARIKRACKKFGIDIGEEEKAKDQEPDEDDKEKMKMKSGYLECRAAIDVPLVTSRNQLTFLPEGTHSITPVGGGIGRPIKVKVDSHAADEMESQRRAIAARTGKRPYFDFNHEDGAASFWPSEFLWRKGEGVVCRGEWSRSGKDAVEGKDFRAFSPVFYVDDKRGDPANVVCREDAKPNMGGLVNDPAFGNLPLWAKNAGATSESSRNNNKQIGENKKMTTEETAALQSRIADAETQVADLRAVVAGDSDNELMIAKLAAAESQLSSLHAERRAIKAEEYADAQDKIISSRAEADAAAAVEAAVKRGAIKSKDEARKKWWHQQIATDPRNADVLRGMPGNEHLFTAITQGNGNGYTGRAIVAAEDPRNVIRKLASLQRNQLTGRASLSEKLAIAREFSAIYAAEFGQYSSGGFNRIAAISPKVIDEALYAGDNTDTNLGTLSGTLVTVRTLELLKLTFPSITSFTTDFSDQPAQFGQTIMTRTITIPAVQTYNTSTGWADSTAATSDVPVTIDQHKGVPITFNSNILESTVRRLFDEFAPAQAYALAKDMVDALYARLTDANFTNNTISTSAAFSRNVCVDVANALDKRGVPMLAGQRTLLLYSDAFASLEKDSTLIQPLAFLQENLIERGQNPPPEFIVPVAGFRVIKAPNLPSNNANLIGFGASKSALVIASRVPNDYTSVLPGAAFGNVAMVTDPDLGLTVLQVQYVNHTLGTATSRISLMYGTAAGQGNAGQLIKANSGSGSSH